MDLPITSTLNDAGVQNALNSLGQMQSAGGPVAMQVVKNSLNGGELAPEFSLRYDLPRFQTGCELLLNMLPLPSGGVTKRPGLKHVGPACAPSGLARLLPFSYSQSIKMMLLLSADSPEANARLFSIDRDGQNEPQSRCQLPYLGSELSQLTYCQCGKVIYLAHKNHRPGKLIFNGLSFKHELCEFAIKTPAPKIASLNISGTPQPDANYYSYKVTAINSETGEESPPSPAMEILASPLSHIFHVVITISPIPNAKEYRVYKRKGAMYGFIGRCVDGNTEFHDDNIAPDCEDSPPEEFLGFRKAGDYPGIVFMHQQRLGYAASENQPMTIWLSQTSNFESMAQKSPPADDDAIEVTLANSQANEILWCVSDRSGLAIGTEGDEWYLTGASGENAGISPNSLSFQPQTRYGSERNVWPARAGASLLFAQAGGKAIRDLGYNYAADKYDAQDVTLLARHLFRFGRITKMCWQGASANTLWINFSNGNMAALLYLPENELTAFSRHWTTDGKFLDVESLQDSEGRSRLWCVVARGIENGKVEKSVELLDLLYEGKPGAWDHAEAIGRPEHLDGKDEVEFVARVIPLLPEQGMEMGISGMRVKKINGVKARVMNCAPFKCRIESQNAQASRVMKAPADTISANKRLGRCDYAEEPTDWICPLGAGFRENGKLVLMFDGPAPATILGIGINLEVAKDGGGQI